MIAGAGAAAISNGLWHGPSLLRGDDKGPTLSTDPMIALQSGRFPPCGRLDPGLTTMRLYHWEAYHC